MTTKSPGLPGLLWSQIRHAILRRVMPVIVISTCLLWMAGCATWFRPSSPVLHKPLPCDLGPVLKIQFPQRIETLVGMPRTETVFQGGTNKFGGRLPDDIKEWFYIRKGTTEYTFIVFYTEAGATKEYERYSDRNVFREATEHGLTGRVHYTEEPRTDREGGSLPMGRYISRADFRLHNLYVSVVTTAHSDRGEKPQNDKLSNAVRDLGQMLSSVFSAGH
jgi:hypothetical protein